MAVAELRLRIQCVLDGQDFHKVERLVGGLAASVRYLTRRRDLVKTHVVLGDCSDAPLSQNATASLRRTARASGIDGLEYDFFDANLGSAGGTNRLACQATEDFLVVLHPDAYPSPTLLDKLLSVFDDPSVGCADARHIPLEHPKEYDISTGDTSWASGSCLIVRMDVFRVVGGFHSDHFFRSCEDVDFSWRVRLAGFRVVHTPSAVVFRDKWIDPAGAVLSTVTEGDQALLERLTLAHRYGRPDVVRQILESVADAELPCWRRVVEEWQRRTVEGSLPEPLSDAAAVAEFIDGQPGRCRF